MTDQSTTPAEGDVAPEAEVETIQTDDADQGLEAGEEGNSDENPDDATPPEEELEDVEFEGKQYKVPKEIRRGLLREADYTAKTTNLARDRDHFNVAQRTFMAQVEAQTANMQLSAEIAAMDRALEQWGQVNFDALEADDPVEAQSQWRRYQQLRQTREAKQGELDGKMREHIRQQQRDRATLLSNTWDACEKIIPGWGKPMLGELMDFGASNYGFTRDEIDNCTDPRLFKLLADARTGRKADATNKTARNITAAQQAKPAARAAAGAAPATPKDPSRMTTAEWMRHRNAQVRKASGG